MQLLIAGLYKVVYFYTNASIAYLLKNNESMLHEIFKQFGLCMYMYMFSNY